MKVRGKEEKRHFGFENTECVRNETYTMKSEVSSTTISKSAVGGRTRGFRRDAEGSLGALSLSLGLGPNEYALVLGPSRASIGEQGQTQRSMSVEVPCSCWTLDVCPRGRALDNCRWAADASTGVGRFGCRIE